MATMNGLSSERLAGAEIHGFRTTADLNLEKLMEDALKRWFRPNEVYAILSNYDRFKIQPQPVDLPENGCVLLFDRKMLRNFRKDGHNWKKKKDGKTVQEAHEKLKISNEERLHVYYARKEDDPNFYRRCYWLLVKNLEHIVLVHYRRTTEDNPIKLRQSIEDDDFPFSPLMQNGSPNDPVGSNSFSDCSSMSTSALILKEINSKEEFPSVPLPPQLKQNDMPADYNETLHNINTLDWEDLLEEPAKRDVLEAKSGDSAYDKKINYDSEVLNNKGTSLVSLETYGGQCSGRRYGETTNGLEEELTLDLNDMDHKFCSVNCSSNLNVLNRNIFRQSDLGSFHQRKLEGSLSNFHNSVEYQKVEPLMSEVQLFSISEISPEWAYSTEETKILLIGHFETSQSDLCDSDLYCVVGKACLVLEAVHDGVYRLKTLPHSPGIVNFYVTFDGLTPVSQILSFEFRTSQEPYVKSKVAPLEAVNNSLYMNDFQLHLRLSHLLFSSTNTLSCLSSKIQMNTINDAKGFVSLTSPLVEREWLHMLNASHNEEISIFAARQELFELILRHKVQEWVLMKIIEGNKTTDYDAHGQGVIHLCAALDYTWAVHLFSVSGISLDFRDARGWTALHWAAYNGREKMVATLLSAAANPSLVTDPSLEYPGGCTASDLASNRGFEGLAAYLAEMGLTAHFEAMSLSGNYNVTPPSLSDFGNSEQLYPRNLTEQEICLKDSLKAYCNAANAADHIQAAFRERSLKIHTKYMHSLKPAEAENIVAAIKIQEAFRCYKRRNKMKAAAQIQGCFRTWKARKNFLHMRRQAIRIQSTFRGYQVRRQYCKIIWSVGVLEKAVLRWRLKRKGLRGLQRYIVQPMLQDVDLEKVTEEDFFRIGREQAEERVKRAVLRVQTMFRSYRAQQEYRRMKLAHQEAKLEFDQFKKPILPG